ncbi:MAG: DUF3990 domain-containing protein [Duncaniella sp.]|nr:DUF3990 domain-containing protein [Duncaniella sp.]
MINNLSSTPDQGFCEAVCDGKTPWVGFDYIEGGVADDRVVNTIRLYMSGFISAGETLNRLQYYKPANQICLLNQELTNLYLNFVESDTIDNL